MTQLMDKLGEIDEAIQVIEAELEEIEGGARPQVIVRQQIFPETTISIGYATKRIREPLSGPVRAVASRGEVHLQAWSR
ncbi:MAG: DUF342 domain-containing protein [bacterium]|nr:DUF342 domain-containing protein [bacterium]